jgi:Kef-type K+ transport system membrane component KefB
MVATYFSQASYLLGAFLSGLAFCRDRTGVDELFRNQSKRMIDWLMKIFFAASIGFQVPVQSFGDTTVISRGFLFALALIGKLAVGLLTPNFF